MKRIALIAFGLAVGYGLLTSEAVTATTPLVTQDCRADDVFKGMPGIPQMRNGEARFKCDGVLTQRYTFYANDDAQMALVRKLGVAGQYRVTFQGDRVIDAVTLREPPKPYEPKRLETVVSQAYVPAAKVTIYESECGRYEIAGQERPENVAYEKGCNVSHVVKAAAALKKAETVARELAHAKERERIERFVQDEKALAARLQSEFNEKQMAKAKSRELARVAELDGSRGALVKPELRASAVTLVLEPQVRRAVDVPAKPAVVQARRKQAPPNYVYKVDTGFSFFGFQN
jgi:hypothetical protein